MNNPQATPADQISIAIVYHSGFGHTKAVAESIAAGAQSVEGVSASLVPVSDLPAQNGEGAPAGRWGELDAADAIVFGSPTYMGTVSAPFKAFMDASSAAWFGQKWRDKIAAGFTNSGSPSGDKVATLQNLAVFAAQHSMIWASCGVFPEPAKKTNRLGGWLGLMTQADNAPPEQTPPPEDHETARLFGARVAQAAARWARGKPA